MAIRNFKGQSAALVQTIFSKLPLRGAELLIIMAIAIYLKWENWLTLGDCSYYTESGRQILAGGNPYLGDAKWGSFSAIVMFTLFGWYPKVIASATLLALNSVGIYKFSKMQAISPKSAFTISVVAAISSVNRENLVNGQITGLILLAIALTKTLNSVYRFPLPSIALTLFAIEMKPQVSVPLILFLFAENELQWKKILFFAIAVHAAVDLYNGRFLEKDFIAQISKTATRNVQNHWENTNNVLPILDQVINNATLTKILGILIVAISSTYIYRYKNEKSLYLLALTALFMPYIHLYDLLGITIICLVDFYKKKHLTIVQILSLMIILSPFRTLSIENIALTGLICLILISNNSTNFLYNSPLLHFLGLLYVPNLFGYFRPQSASIQNSWITTSVLVALTLLITRTREFKHHA